MPDFRLVAFQGQATPPTVGGTDRSTKRKSVSVNTYVPACFAGKRHVEPTPSPHRDTPEVHGPLGADEAGSTGQQLMLEEAAKGVRATRARHA